MQGLRGARPPVWEDEIYLLSHGFLGVPPALIIIVRFQELMHIISNSEFSNSGGGVRAGGCEVGGAPPHPAPLYPSSSHHPPSPLAFPMRGAEVKKHQTNYEKLDFFQDFCFSSATVKNSSELVCWVGDFEFHSLRASEENKIVASTGRTARSTGQRKLCSLSAS